MVYRYRIFTVSELADADKKFLKKGLNENIP